MKKPYEITHSVLESYRGLAEKLSRITGKTPQWYRSQGYAPADQDSLTNGNVSSVDKFMEMCELYQAAEPGAGRMLADRTHTELSARFTEKDLFTTTQRDLHVHIETETCDVRKWLASFDIDTAKRNELAVFESECDEAISAIMEAQSRARARLRMIQLARSR